MVLSHILLFTDCAGNGINLNGTSACEVLFTTIYGSCDGADDFLTAVQVRTVPAFLCFAGIFNEVRNISDLSKGVGFVKCWDQSINISHGRAVCDQAICHLLRFEKIGYIYILRTHVLGLRSISMGGK